MRLTELGWDDDFARAFEEDGFAVQEGVQPGRVAIGFNYLYRLYVDSGELEAVLAGRVKHHARSRGELPAVGDWVAVRQRRVEDRGTILGVLPRRSRFSRRMAGNVTDEQVVAANVDAIFIVMALDEDFSIRRLERYLLLARESGAAPIILLTKPDVATDVPAQAAAVAAVAGGVPMHVISPRNGDGIDQVAAHLRTGRTGALLGSSGVGKTTIINRLVGTDIRRTREVRAADSKGRHTTTHRELVVLPQGGLVIDTPGMRELQLWEGGDAVRETFDDIDLLAPSCHFTDCRHRGEPRCAVKAAVEAGSLDAARLASYHKLQDELAHVARQQDERAQQEEKRRSKVMGKAIKQYLREKGAQR
jgi:ribosome biogenesis GTPase